MKLAEFESILNQVVHIETTEVSQIYEQICIILAAVKDDVTHEFAYVMNINDELIKYLVDFLAAQAISKKAIGRQMDCLIRLICETLIVLTSKATVYAREKKCQRISWLGMWVDQEKTIQTLVDLACSPSMSQQLGALFLLDQLLEDESIVKDIIFNNSICINQLSALNSSADRPDEVLGVVNTLLGRISVLFDGDIESLIVKYKSPSSVDVLAQDLVKLGQLLRGNYFLQDLVFKNDGLLDLLDNSLCSDYSDPRYKLTETALSILTALFSTSSAPIEAIEYRQRDFGLRFANKIESIIVSFTSAIKDKEAAMFCLAELLNNNSNLLRDITTRPDTINFIASLLRVSGAADGAFFLFNALASGLNSCKVIFEMPFITGSLIGYFASQSDFSLNMIQIISAIAKSCPKLTLVDLFKFQGGAQIIKKVLSTLSSCSIKDVGIEESGVLDLDLAKLLNCIELLYRLAKNHIRLSQEQVIYNQLTLDVFQCIVEVTGRIELFGDSDQYRLLYFLNYFCELDASNKAAKVVLGMEGIFTGTFTKNKDVISLLIQLLYIVFKRLSLESEAGLIKSDAMRVRKEIHESIKYFEKFEVDTQYRLVAMLVNFYESIDREDALWYSPKCKQLVDGAVSVADKRVSGLLEQLKSAIGRQYDIKHKRFSMTLFGGPKESRSFGLSRSCPCLTALYAQYGV